MNSWLNLLIVISVIGMGVRALIPNGEKSPLYPAIKLLLSLLLILTVFTPLIGLIKSKPLFSFDHAEISSPPFSSQELLLYRSAEELRDAAQKAHPSVHFSIEVYTKDDGIFDYVCVRSDQMEDAERIAIFLENNFQIKATAKENEKEGVKPL